MHDIFQIRLADVPSSFDEVKYIAGRPEVLAFMKTFCEENNIPERVRLYYHFLQSKTFEIPFMDCKRQLIAKNYEYVYSTISNKLSALSHTKSYYPLSHWLLESAIHVNAVDELREKLIGVAETATIKKLKEAIDNYQQKKYDFQKAVVVFAFNGGYENAFMVSILSLIKSNRSILNKLFFVVGADDTADLKKIDKYLKALKIEFKLVNMTSLASSNLRESYDGNTEFILDKSCYYRIFLLEQICQEFSENYEKAFYIDSDTLVLGDISELLATRMHKPLLAKNEKVTEEAVKKAKKINNIDYYFNSGVLLLDLKNKETLECLKMTLEAAKHKQSKLMLQDQCALNIGFNGKVEELNPKFNYMLHMHECINTQEKLIILHFTGRIKPWSHAYVDSPFFKGIWETFYSEAKMYCD